MSPFENCFIESKCWCYELLFFHRRDWKALLLTSCLSPCDVGGPLLTTRLDVLGHWSPFVLPCHLKVPGSGGVVVSVSCEEKGKWTRPFYQPERGTVGDCGCHSSAGIGHPAQTPNADPDALCQSVRKYYDGRKNVLLCTGTGDRFISWQCPSCCHI